MIHKMKLNESPFERIKNGTKTIEFRLYDEKRQQIKIGDQIEFSKLPDLQEKLLVDVIELYRENTFENLFRKLYTDENEINRKTKSIITSLSLGFDSAINNVNAANVLLSITCLPFLYKIS